MKILYITNAIDGSGGLERVLSIKASLLADDYDYEVHILTLNQKSKNNLFFIFSDKIIQHNIQVSGNPLIYSLKYIKGINRIVKKISPDVISVCDDGLKAFLIPKIIGNKIPLIYERHVSKLIELSDNQNYIQRLLKKIKFIIMNFLAKDYNEFVVLTDGNKNEWKLKNIQVIPNPLSFLPKESSQLANKKIIAVGKQSYQKSYDRLLEIWKKFSETKKDWQLHIYGNIDASQKLQELAVTLGVDKSVYFHEPEKNIQKKFLESSIFVLSSRYEGFGMVIIEAMSCGLPCVSFDCPYGPSDIIKDSHNGFLIDNGNINKFAEKLVLLAENHNMRTKFGNNAKNEIIKYYPKSILDRWDALFKSIIKNNV